MAKNRTPTQIERDRRKISELYLKGWIQEDIAEEVGLNQSTVSRDLKAIQKKWQQDTLYDFNEAKARELERVDVLEREYWQAWEDSKDDAETIRQEGTPKQLENGQTIPTPSKIVSTKKGQTGDPRYLAGVQWCIERRCKILGIDAAIKSQSFNLDLSNLTTEQLERLANGEDVYSVIATPGAG